MTHSRKHSPDRFLNVWVSLVKKKKIAYVTAGKIQNAAACKNEQALCLCRQTVLNLVVLYRLSLWWYRFEKELKHSPKSETALVPKLSPFTQLLLIKQRKPFNPSPSVCSFFFLPSYFFFCLSFTTGPLSHFQQRTILKVYQQLLVNPFLLLCAPFSGVPFLLPPPRGLLERRALSWPCGEKMAEFIPCCVGDNTPERDTSRLRLQAEDSFLAFSLSPRLQCWH